MDAGHAKGNDLDTVISEHMRDVLNALPNEEEEEVREAFRRILENDMNSGQRPSINRAKVELVLSRHGDVSKLTRFSVPRFSEVKNGVGMDANRGFDVVARVLSIKEREVKKEGEDLKKYYGTLYDGSETLAYMTWSPPAFNVNDVVLLCGVSVRDMLGGGYEIFIPKGSDMYVLSPDLIPTTTPPRGGVPPGPAVEASIGDIHEKNRWKLKARVYRCEKSTSRKGTPLLRGVLLDGSGSVPFIAFGDVNLEAGKGYVLDGVRARRFRDGLQVTIDENTVIGDIGGDEEKYLPLKLQRIRLAELSPTNNYALLRCRIMSMESKEIPTKDGGTMTIHTGECGDETGILPYTVWSSEAPFDVGACVEIEGVSVRTRRGFELSIDERCIVSKLPDDALPKVNDLKGRGMGEVELYELEAKGGGSGIGLKGVVVDIKPGSGLIKRCTRCRKVLREGLCPEHGDDPGEWDLRIKATIDDGTGTTLAIFNTKAVEDVIDRSLEDIKSSGDMDADKILRVIRERILLRPVKVGGNGVLDDFGLKVIATSADVGPWDWTEEANSLLEEYSDVL